ncbi:hypothetical protein SSS_01761 [Sarcoptes scabiei]|nr:hypothetical protein SSS_01761 [Sarcoptes scabiei]
MASASALTGSTASIISFRHSNLLPSGDGISIASSDAKTLVTAALNSNNCSIISNYSGSYLKFNQTSTTKELISSKMNNSFYNQSQSKIQPESIESMDSSRNLLISNSSKEEICFTSVNETISKQKSIEKKLISNDNLSNIAIEERNKTLTSASILNKNNDSSTIDQTMMYGNEDSIMNDIRQENPNNSSQTLSPSSSSSNENSPKKKRRRGEKERLMDDLSNSNSPWAAHVSKMLIETEETERTTSNQSHCNSDNNKEMENQENSSKSNESSKSSKARMPSLRPRRNIRPPSGYYSSDSCSPVFYSPIKNRFFARQNVESDHQKCENNIKQSIILHAENQSIIENEVKKEFVDSESIDRIKPNSLDRIVRKNIDVSVFSTLISPIRLDSNSLYEFNYVSLKIIQIKPLRTLTLTPKCMQEQSLTCPVLELITTDVNDRFNIDYLKGVFDDPEISSISSTNLIVYLMGTYALKSKDLAHKGSMINIVKFRTTNRRDNNTKNIKKRKFLEQKEYPFAIIVDSPADYIANSIQIESNLNSKRNDFVLDPKSTSSLSSSSSTSHIKNEIESDSVVNFGSRLIPIRMIYL